MVLFATSGLTYVLNMFSFIRRRSAVDLLFYSGRQTRAAYVQHKLRRMGKTQGTCSVPKMLGRADLMWDCSQLVSISLDARRDRLARAGDAPILSQPESPSERWICVLQVTCFDRAESWVARKKWPFLCKAYKRQLQREVALIAAAYGVRGEDRLSLSPTLGTAGPWGDAAVHRLRAMAGIPPDFLPFGENSEKSLPIFSVYSF